MRRMHVLAGIVAAVLAAASLLPAHAQEPERNLLPIPDEDARVQPDLDLGSRSIPVTAPLTVGDLRDLRLRISSQGDLDHCTYDYMTPGNAMTAISEAAVPRIKIHLADGTVHELDAITVDGVEGDYAVLASCQENGDNVEFGFGMETLPADAVVRRVELVEAQLAVKYLQPAGADVQHRWSFDFVSAAFLGGSESLGASVIGWTSHTGSKVPVYFSARGDVVFEVAEVPAPTPDLDPEPPAGSAAAAAAAAPARPVTAAPTFTG